MFIKIDANNTYISEDAGKSIQYLESSYYLNFNKLIQVDFQDCFIEKRVLNTRIRLEHLIRLYVLVEEGVWNFMTLYFTKSNDEEFQRIKKIVEQ